MPHPDLHPLRRWLGSSGITLSEAQLAQSRIFLDTLLLWNRKVNLVAQQRVDDIVTKHLADSFFAASFIGADDCLADIGSGAGFPGIPCAILRPAAAIVLFEANQKRASFLADAVSQCRLEHVQVVGQRVEDSPRHRFKTVTARAFSHLAALITTAATILEPGGRLIAMKGPKYEAELEQVDESRCKLERVVPYELADTSQRFLVILRFT